METSLTILMDGARTQARSTGAPADDAASASSALIVFVLVVIWALTGFGDFWPIWVVVRARDPDRAAVRDPQGAARRRAQWRALDDPRRDLRASSADPDVFIWALTGVRRSGCSGRCSASASRSALHALITSWWRALHPVRERELTERVDVLTRTRRGALDVQAAELRRIERDLHDGAQARLVALSMQLGRAEDRLEEHPEAAELVRNARVEAASTAIGELRDLARGIAPPVLADRGLAGRRRLARRALGARR